MRMIFGIAFALLCMATTAFARDADAVRIIPPDFPEIDFGIAITGDHFRVRVLNDCALTGQATGGLWVGRQISPTEWDADLHVPLNYARTHHGNFFGTYKICRGSGGTGLPPELKWKGSAGAGHKFVGPMIADLLYIHHFDTALAFDEAVNTFAIEHDYGLSLSQLGILKAFLALLNQSANPVPPSFFIDESDWAQTLVATKQYRGYNKFSILIDVNKDNQIISHTFDNKDQSTGYTPFHGLFIPGVAGPATFEIPTVTSDFIILHKRIDARIDLLLAAPFAFSILEPHVPYAWSDINYRINSDGTYVIVVFDSHFPTHNLYIGPNIGHGHAINWNLDRTLPQTDLGRFIFVDPSFVDAPPSAASPVTFSGQSEAE